MVASCDGLKTIGSYSGPSSFLILLEEGFDPTTAAATLSWPDYTVQFLYGIILLETLQVDCHREVNIIYRSGLLRQVTQYLMYCCASMMDHTYLERVSMILV